MRSDDAERQVFLPLTTYDTSSDDLSDAGSVVPDATSGRRRLQWLSGAPRWKSPRRQSCHHRITTLIVLQYGALLVLVFFCTHALVAPSYKHPPAHYAELATRCHPASKSNLTGCANTRNEKVFISVSLYDPNGGLADGRWGNQLVQLVDLIGPDNVFVSIYENDSGPLGAASLNVLRSQLSCRHNIVSERHVSLDGFPTVALPDGSEHIKRTTYLAEMRNRALEPLSAFSDDQLGTSQFDKMLFLNDVIYDPIDAAHLLFDTNRGSDGTTHYLTACALDYYHDPFMVYDSYAMRDADGYAIGEGVYPFFSTAGRGLSRAAVLAQSDAVPVKSCWGGMVAMQAAYVQGGNRSSVDSASHHLAIDPDDPISITTPVRFRGEPEAFYDACECCLFIADVSQAALTEDAAEQGVFINPYVRTAYSTGVFSSLSWGKSWERLLTVPQRFLSWAKHKPYSSPYRSIAQGDTFQEEVWLPAGAERETPGWQMVERKGRSGMFCGLRLMQVIKPRENGQGYRWENAPIPAGHTFDASI